MKFFNFKFSSKLLHNLTPVNSDFFCPAVLKTRGKKKLDDLGFLVLRKCIFSNLMNSSRSKKSSFIVLESMHKFC